MSDINMSVNIAGVELKNPVTVASGTFGSGMEYGEYVDLNRLGAVTTKGVANIPWPGNPTPRIAETYGGMMNAIGLQNPGLDTFVKRDIPFLKQYDTKIIVNVCGKSEADYVDAVENLVNSQLTFLKSISHALMSKRVELLSDRFHLLQRLLLRRLRRLQSSRLL